MTAAVFRLFGHWEFGKGVETLPDRARPASRGEYADALSAGWVPPVPAPPAEVRAPLQTSGQELDADEFLARVYLYQEC
ncbi:MAG: hypothetical protein HY017_32470 [Betaproteobacteria bacterium]|nr:hypothetical protein [Betaproteobacteria bacterium]